MDQAPPFELSGLLDGPDPASREAAWSAFVQRYSKLFLKAAAAFGGDYDDRMDRYRQVLEGLREDDFRRLRGYRTDSRSSFGGWLLVVSRRLCVDFDRARYGRGGRSRTAPELEKAERRTRRRLVELIGSDIDPMDLPAAGGGPEAGLRIRELLTGLTAATAELTPADRLLLRLRFEDDLGMRQIADVMHFPTVFHAYRRLRIVLALVRLRLEARGIDEAVP